MDTNKTCQVLGGENAQTRSRKANDDSGGGRGGINISQGKVY